MRTGTRHLHATPVHDRTQGHERPRRVLGESPDEVTAARDQGDQTPTTVIAQPWRTTATVPVVGWHGMVPPPEDSPPGATAIEPRTNGLDRL